MFIGATAIFAIIVQPAITAIGAIAVISALMKVAVNANAGGAGGLAIVAGTAQGTIKNPAVASCVTVAGIANCVTARVIAPAKVVGTVAVVAYANQNIAISLIAPAQSATLASGIIMGIMSITSAVGAGSAYPAVVVR